MTVCIIDTGIFDELLAVPGWSNAHARYYTEFEAGIAANHAFLLPLPVLLETGNHIAQAADGNRRRQCAMTFKALARKALSGDSPFRVTGPPSVDEVKAWLDDFPEHAARKIGLVDRSLIDLFEREKTFLRGGRRLYIWSLDHALVSYDTHAT